ncbi:MAG: hypothetical protein KIT58_03410 [Planctomycetota bacterium]|nr:hypothetical protein [Planctomycetota bacterium]
MIAAEPVDHDKRWSVARVHEENLRFYSTPDGLAFLKALELTFDEQWLYVFELFQNALDAGAGRVSIAAEGDRFVLEHDGSEPIEARHVEGMSKLFRSTKGATTVGFMGIGLKSVFKRFRALGVCGFGWSFKFEVGTVVGKVFGDVQPDLIGAVLPVWTDGLSTPSSGFTTRFELSGLSEPDRPLSQDLGHVLDNAKAVLAALAWRGLRELRLGEEVWTLEGTGGEGVVSAVSGSTANPVRWRVFPHAYRPSAEAIKKFLELRRLQPESGREVEFADTARRERHALLVVPIDKDGVPVATGRGKVYATFPTQATLPFELHLNADWLLGISRTGLRELEECPSGKRA